MTYKNIFIFIILLFFSTSDAMAIKILEDIGKTLDKAVKKGAEEILKDVEKKEQEKEKTEDKETQKPAESKPVLKKEAKSKSECDKGIEPKQWTNCIGTITNTKGSKYVGKFKGTETFANGDKYVGEWKDGKFHGQGTETFANGNKYVGELKDGKRNGQGTYTFANGNKYVGEHKDGLPHGQGTHTFADGEKYVGEHKDGKRNGQGTLTLANGAKYVGEFKDGEYVEEIKKEPETSKQESWTSNTLADGTTYQQILESIESIYSMYIPIKLNCVTSKVLNKSEYQPFQNNTSNFIGMMLTAIKVPEDKWDQIKDEQYNKALEKLENDETYIFYNNFLKGGLSDVKKMEYYVLCSEELLPGMNLFVNSFAEMLRETTGIKPKTQEKRDGEK